MARMILLIFIIFFLAILTPSFATTVQLLPTPTSNIAYNGCTSPGTTALNDANNALVNVSDNNRYQNSCSRIGGILGCGIIVSARHTYNISQYLQPGYTLNWVRYCKEGYGNVDNEYYSNSYWKNGTTNVYMDDGTKFNWASETTICTNISGTNLTWVNDSAQMFNTYVRVVDSSTERLTECNAYLYWDFGNLTVVYTYTPPADITIPTYSNMGQNTTNATTIALGKVVNLSAQWNDNIALDKWIFYNGTNNMTASSFTGANWTNVTWNSTGLTKGTTYTLKFYANDTSNNQNVTGIWQYTIDGTAPTYNVNGTNNTNPLPLEQVLYYTNWSDNVGLSYWIFSWNATGALCNEGFANDSAEAFTGTWSNVTKQAPLACAGRVIDFLFYANDTSNNWNKTIDMIETEESANQYLNITSSLSILATSSDFRRTNNTRSSSLSFISSSDSSRISTMRRLNEQSLNLDEQSSRKFDGTRTNDLAISFNDVISRISQMNRLSDASLSLLDSIYKSLGSSRLSSLSFSISDSSNRLFSTARTNILSVYFGQPAITDYALRTCSDTFDGLGCNDPTTNDALSPCDGSQIGSETIIEAYINATSVLGGTVINATCQFSEFYHPFDYSYEQIYYYNTTDWLLLWSDSYIGTSGEINKSTTFVANSTLGTHYVRCGIVYSNTTKMNECINSSYTSNFDNDDVNFIVVPSVQTIGATRIVTAKRLNLLFFNTIENMLRRFEVNRLNTASLSVLDNVYRGWNGGRLSDLAFEISDSSIRTFDARRLNDEMLSLVDESFRKYNPTRLNVLSFSLSDESSKSIILERLQDLSFSMFDQSSRNIRKNILNSLSFGLADESFRLMTVNRLESLNINLMDNGLGKKVGEMISRTVSLTVGFYDSISAYGQAIIETFSMRIKDTTIGAVIAIISIFGLIIFLKI